MSKLCEIWQSPSGRYSFKRVFGTASFLVGSFLAIKYQNAELVLIFITAATTAAGFGLAERNGNKTTTQNSD